MSEVMLPMLFLPIVDRELRVAARTARTYWSRVFAGVAALAMSLYLVWLAQHALGGPTAGMFILKSTTYLAWGLCVFGGVNRTCDAVSAEKRADTLGLLFLTRLRAHDIVLGKLLAHGLNSVYLLFAVLPVLSVPVMMGGVAANEMVRIPLALLNTLFLSLSLGLFVSCFVRSQRLASAVAGGIIVVLGVLLPLAAQLADREWENPELARWLRVPSPLSTQEMAFTTAIGLRVNDFWKSLFLQFILGLGALWAGCFILPNAWKQKGARSPSINAWRLKLKQWTQGTSEGRSRRRTRWLEKNPWFWLCSRDQTGPLWPGAVALTTFGAAGWCIVHYDIPKMPACAILFAAVAVNDVVNRMRVSNLASYRLAEDRQSGALEMILSTSLSVEEILRGTWQTVRRVQLPVYCALLLVYLCLINLFVHESGSALESWATALFFAAISAEDFVVLGYVAMWKGMRCAHPKQAAGLALLRVTLVPFLISLGCLPALDSFPAFHAVLDSGEPYSYLICGFVIWSVSSTIALMTARLNLRKYFREAATDRYLFEQRLHFLPRRRRQGPAAAQPPSTLPRAVQT